jgi:hypothetical protein
LTMRPSYERRLVSGRASTPAMVWHTTSRQKANRRSVGTLAVVTSLLPRICSVALTLGEGRAFGFKVTPHDPNQ